MRLVFLVIAGILLFSVFGCVSSQQQVQASQPKQASEVSVSNASNGLLEGQQASSNFKEWKSPDGAITIQVPEGWQASEKQVDKCTVNWAVVDPKGTSAAYMNNQIMILKSKAHGLAGIDSVPVSGYLGAEQATQQIFAPLTGATNVQVTYKDAESSTQFSQAVCINGLAACDAKVFEAAYSLNGILMRGKYFVQSYDFGEGTTWWINVWGYTSPAAEWSTSSPVLENVFTSVKTTYGWDEKCSKSTNEAVTVINEVIKNRQESSDKSAEAWDEYIKG